MFAMRINFPHRHGGSSGMFCTINRSSADIMGLSLGVAIHPYCCNAQVQLSFINMVLRADPAQRLGDSLDLQGTDTGGIADTSNGGR
jgi:hypothetical protein